MERDRLLPLPESETSTSSVPSSPLPDFRRRLLLGSDNSTGSYKSSEDNDSNSKRSRAPSTLDPLPPRPRDELIESVGSIVSTANSSTRTRRASSLPPTPSESLLDMDDEDFASEDEEDEHLLDLSASAGRPRAYAGSGRFLAGGDDPKRQRSGTFTDLPPLPQEPGTEDRVPITRENVERSDTLVNKLQLSPRYSAPLQYLRRRASSKAMNVAHSPSITRRGRVFSKRIEPSALATTSTSALPEVHLPLYKRRMLHIGRLTSSKKESKPQLTEFDIIHCVLPENPDESFEQYVDRAFASAEEVAISCTQSELDPARFTCKRDYVAREILTSERDYLRNLTTLINVFVNPLKQLVPAETVTSLFSNVIVLYGVNMELLRTLEECVSAWTPDSLLSPIFQRFIPFLKIYYEYTSAFENANRNLVAMEALPNFSEFLEICMDVPETAHRPLRSFLIMPVQRIPRYSLLLRDLIRATSPDHPDYEGLKKALEDVDELTERANTLLAESERKAKMIEIRAMFTDRASKVTEFGIPALIQPHRNFVRQGLLTKVSRREEQVRRFFLFNDILIYGTENSDGKVKINRLVKLDEAKVDKGRVRPPVPSSSARSAFDTMPLDEWPSIRSSNLNSSTSSARSGNSPPNSSNFPKAMVDSSARQQEGWSARENPLSERELTISSPAKSFVVRAETFELRDSWFKDLSETIEIAFEKRTTFIGAQINDSHRSRNSGRSVGDSPPSSPVPGSTPNFRGSAFFLAPVWVPDHEAKSCFLCNANFTTFRRRHHCRRCGLVVCADCSPHRVKLTYIQKGNVRICDECVKGSYRAADGSYRHIDDRVH